MNDKGRVVATIESIVEDLPEIDYKQVLYEAITNSLQANAKDITIKFIYEILNFKKEDIADDKKVLKYIQVEDNGEGFTDKNISAFKEYKTKNKIHLGCKGVGRFLYLKLFEKVEILSLNKIIDFEINKDINIKEQNKHIKKTIVKLLKPKKRIIVNFDDLEKNLQDHFIAYFKLLINENKNVNINVFCENTKKFEIDNSYLPNFSKKEFKIKKHNFVLSYVFNNKKFNNEGYYCAGKRVVVKNSELDQNKKLKLFKQFNILYLLESDYLDNNVKSDTRDDFTIYPKRKSNDDLFSSISWEEINEHLKNNILEIAKENGMDLEELAKKNLKIAFEKAPYLGPYFDIDDFIFDEEELIKYAKQKLEQDKNYIRTENTTDYHKLAKVTQSELAEYVFDREKIINKLKKLVEDNEIEREIHNLFMKQKTEDEKSDYRTNHLWLFDDRFMTYDKVFSDKQIKEIFPKLSENLNRPDLLSIISNTYNKNMITDVVVIELKRASQNITPAGAEEQLLDYASYINENFDQDDRKVRIWCYAFIKFNPDSERKFKNKGYNRVFTQSDYPSYYKYFDEVNAIINFIDYKTLSYDAELRNKTFLKILKGNNI